MGAAAPYFFKMSQETAYVFRGNSIYRQTTHTQKIGLSKDAFSQLAEINGLTVRNPFKELDFFSISKQGRQVFSHFSTKLNEINLNTHFKPYTGEVFGDASNWPAITPVFANEDGTIKNEVKWEPPEYMNVYFVSSFSQGDEPSYENYLLCKIDDELHRPPFPNIYDDSRICMGYDYARSNGSLFDIHLNALEFFNAASWNRDLLNTQSNYLLFNPDGKAIHPDKKTYQDWLPIISSSRFSWAVDL